MNSFTEVQYFRFFNKTPFIGSLRIKLKWAENEKTTTTTILR